jgi:oligopeptide transport system ATP-binding protein
MPPETIAEDRSSAPGQDDPILYARGLRKQFGEVVAVHEVDLELPAGGSLAVVGESGSGKTTVARMIVGLIKPTAGEIVACGNDRSTPTRKPSERRRRGAEVQIVFQDPYSSLDPRHSAADAIDEVLKLHHKGGDGSARKLRIDELGEMVGLDSRMMRAMPKALSGGQRQRIAIARALAAEPRILVLDEAVAALDVSIQAQVLNLLTDIREQTGVSYVFISHDLAVVRQITEDVIVMQRGHVVERGRTLDVLDDPQDPYTKLLRASVPRPGWKPVRRGNQVAPPEGEESSQ